MDFITSIQTCFRQYFTFSGRARRSEYWWFYLFTFLGGLVTGLIDLVTNPNTEIVGTLFSLAVLIPTLSVGARRLHDINKSGWWQALPLIGLAMMLPGFLHMLDDGLTFEQFSFTPLFIIGILVVLATSILLIVWFATDGEHGANRFGDSPKYGGVESAFD